MENKQINQAEVRYNNHLHSKTNRMETYIAGGAIFLVTLFLFQSASAQVNSAPEKFVYNETLPLNYIFTILFLVLGPFKIIGPFAKITAGADRVLSRNIAILAIAFSTAALLIAAFMGDSFLKNYNISIPILALTAGIILFLVALIAILQQFQPVNAHHESIEPPTLKMAMTPLAFPTIVTPYGIAILIVLLALIPASNRMAVFAIVSGIMVLDLLFMLVMRLISQKIFQLIAIVLQILASVLGIMQVALGLKIIYKSLIVLLK